MRVGRGWVASLDQVVVRFLLPLFVGVRCLYISLYLFIIMGQQHLRTCFAESNSSATWDLLEAAAAADLPFVTLDEWIYLVVSSMSSHSPSRPFFIWQ